jgi:poly(hydroxyalkanoate) depolymerase family esterase
VIVGVLAAWPATAAAAPLPGLPSWSGTTPWWRSLSGGEPPTVRRSAAPVPGGPAAGQGGSFSGTYVGAGGSRSYRGYVPSTYKDGTPVPLVVVLHGCGQSPDVIRQLTRFDALAEAKGFIAVFPEQPQSANQQSCWNFFQDANMHRGSGEPALIAGITQWVQQHYSVDKARTYVAGLSAGGAMASVMGATYPDLYAAIGVGSGCEYAATAACAGAKSADPAQAAQAAHKEMGSQARTLPVIAFQGDKDTTVPPINADQLLQQWQLTDNMAGGSAASANISSTPTSTTDGQVPNGRAYTVRAYGDANSQDLLEYWVVHGMTHAWSGGCGCESFSDPQGPDETAAMYAFFLKHPMG